MIFWGGVKYVIWVFDTDSKTFQLCKLLYLQKLDYPQNVFFTFAKASTKIKKNN